MGHGADGHDAPDRMTGRSRPGEHAVYLEVGDKRVFAGAIDWPGWARSGRDEDAALEALFAYAPRYARVLKGTRLGFDVPEDPSALRVVERLPGTATTDFGAPDVPPSADAEPVSDTDLGRFATLFRACWRAFDRAAEAAENVELTKGPRGGGRDLEKIVDHALGSDESYLSMIGAKAPRGARTGERSGTAARCSMPSRSRCARVCRRDLAGESAGHRGTSSGGRRGTRSTTPGKSRTGHPGLDVASLSSARQTVMTILPRAWPSARYRMASGASISG
jgi:hypothetical protein